MSFSLRAVDSDVRAATAILWSETVSFFVSIKDMTPTLICPCHYFCFIAAISSQIFEKLRLRTVRSAFDRFGGFFFIKQ